MSALELALDPDVEAVDTLRGHTFQPDPTILGAIPALYETETQREDAKTVHVHYFVGGCDWWVTELDPETWRAFGPVRMGAHPPEWGYFDLAELAQITVTAEMGLGPDVVALVPIPVERDLYWSPRPWGQVER